MSWKWLRDILYFHLFACPKSFVFWSVVLLELEVEDTMDSPIESHLTTLGLKADEKNSTQEVVKAYKYTNKIFINITNFTAFIPVENGFCNMLLEKVVGR